jgi:ribose transport system ATP-binding protein
MSDRALVMHQGRLAGVLDREQLSEESIMQLATGTSHQMATSVLQELL